MMELKELKEIRIELYCDRETCRGCENLKKCDYCSTNFCINHQDERGEWGVMGDDDLCPICFARENYIENEKESSQSEGSEK